MSDKIGGERGPRFSYHYIDRVRRASLACMVSNADIARVLQRADDRITTSHVVRWREQHPSFNRACDQALDEHLEDIANVVAEAAKDGDVGAARYILDRLHPAYMPKTKGEMKHTGEGLDDMLRRRASDDDLRAQGIIRDRQREPDEDDYA